MLCLPQPTERSLSMLTENPITTTKTTKDFPRAQESDIVDPIDHDILTKNTWTLQVG